MALHPLDGYLLDGVPAKEEAVAAVLAARAPVDAAQPFYRALEALGARVADEALIAMRVALAGRRPDDAEILTLRAHLAAARGGDAGGRRAYLAAVETRAAE
jgi:hypothetical protein